MKNKTITLYELLGLIKDGKAPKKIEYKGDIYIFAGEDYSKNDDRETWLITEDDYFLSTFLNEEVEILPEENDEWEDIEELGKLNFGGDCKTRYYSKNAIGYEFPEEIINIINQIIKNQKYLKERLIEKNEK